MKIAAYTALTYGSPYLKYAIESVIDSVNEYVVLYSDHGSHSGRRNRFKPKGEGKSKLFSIAHGAAQDKLKWVNGDWQFEGKQRDSIWQHTDADFVIVLDYDEVWPIGAVERSLALCARYRANIRLPLIHFWRSFQWAVIDDMAAPVRVMARGATKEVGNGHEKLLHFGYAIPDDLMRYKWTIHGHHTELRKDIDWFAERWQAFAKEDVHPTNVKFWNPQRVESIDLLPDSMQYHPFWNMGLIP